MSQQLDNGAIEKMIDILDINDVYCPAIIQSRINSNGTITVSYPGWSEEWNEVLPANSERISQKMNTKICKAWVKLSSKFCHWPCKIFIRYPLKGLLSHFH